MAINTIEDVINDDLRTDELKRELKERVLFCTAMLGYTVANFIISSKKAYDHVSTRDFIKLMETAIWFASMEAMSLVSADFLFKTKEKLRWSRLFSSDDTQQPDFDIDTYYKHLQEDAINYGQSGIPVSSSNVSASVKRAGDKQRVNHLPRDYYGNKNK